MSCCNAPRFRLASATGGRSAVVCGFGRDDQPPALAAVVRVGRTWLTTIIMHNTLAGAFRKGCLAASVSTIDLGPWVAARVRQGPLFSMIEHIIRKISLSRLGLIDVPARNRLSIRIN